MKKSRLLHHFTFASQVVVKWGHIMQILALISTRLQLEDWHSYLMNFGRFLLN